MPLKKISKQLNFFSILYKSAADKGIILILSALLAIAFTNSLLAPYYKEIIDYKFYFYGYTFEFDFFVNDFLMAIFFMLIGIEIKHEMTSGHLMTKQQRILPVCAAIGGVVVPVLIYAFFNYQDTANIRGWAVPAATDIAFSLGILAIFAKRLPVSLKIFLMALAIIDDLIAVLILAIFYSDNISSYYVSMIAVMVLLMLCLNLLKSNSAISYSIMGVALWYAFLKSGIHPTLAGVVFGMMIPHSKNAKKDLPKYFNDKLAPHVSYFILPLFAFINSGIELDISLDDLINNTVATSIAGGLFFGKQIGIFGTIMLLNIFNIAKLPQGATAMQTYAVSVICGIGFTMSLFITNLAYEGNLVLLHSMKLGVLLGSFASAFLGVIILMTCARK